MTSTLSTLSCTNSETRRVDVEADDVMDVAPGLSGASSLGEGDTGGL